MFETASRIADHTCPRLVGAPGYGCKRRSVSTGTILFYSSISLPADDVKRTALTLNPNRAWPQNAWTPDLRIVSADSRTLLNMILGEPNVWLKLDRI